MNNISSISKAKRLTEEEVHAAASELQANGTRVSSIEVYKHLGRGSLTTITNFLKTWNQEDQVKDALPALIELPEALKKATEQLILKVWTESQAIAEKELASQREVLRQAENLAKEKITEAEAFSEEQAKQIQALMDHIEEIKDEKVDEINFLRSLIEELKTGIVTEQDERIKISKKEAEARSKITELEAKITELTTERNKDQEYAKQELKLLNYKLEDTQKNETIAEQRLIEAEKQLKKAEVKINELETKLEVQREKAAKLEGELTAWKSIKPKSSSKKKPVAPNSEPKQEVESSETINVS